MGFSANGYFQCFRLWLCSPVTTADSHKYRLNHSPAAGPTLGWRQHVDGLETVFCPQPGSVRSGSPVSRPGPGSPQQPSLARVLFLMLFLFSPEVAGGHGEPTMPDYRGTFCFDPPGTITCSVVPSKLRGTTSQGPACLRLESLQEMRNPCFLYFSSLGNVQGTVGGNHSRAK